MADSLNIIVMNHGNFGEWLIDSASMIVGEIDNIYTLPLHKGISIETYIEQVAQKIEQLDGPYILMTDMYGGTPNNAALHIQLKYSCKVITGINLPMLLELVLIRNREDLSLDEIVDSTVEAGSKSIYECSI